MTPTLHSVQETAASFPSLQHNKLTTGLSRSLMPHDANLLHSAAPVKLLMNVALIEHEGKAGNEELRAARRGRPPATARQTDRHLIKHISCTSMHASRNAGRQGCHCCLALVRRQ
jgi:hypothetical protein